MSYWDWRADMDALAEKGPDAVQEKLLDELNRRQVSLLSDTITLPGGMIAGFGGGDVFVVAASVIRGQRKYLLAESVGSVDPIGDSNRHRAHSHELIVASGPVIGDYEQGFYHHWAIPFVDQDRTFGPSYLDTYREIFNGNNEKLAAFAVRGLEQELRRADEQGKPFAGMEVARLIDFYSIVD